MFMKYCENGHSNRDDAKFCGTCGRPIVQKTGFTLDVFPNISFKVTDYIKFKESDECSIILKLLLSGPIIVFFVAGVCRLMYIMLCTYYDLQPSNIDDITSLLFCLVIGIIPCVVKVILMLIRYFRLKANSDFIEVTDQVYARIAKKSKLGLLEKCDGYRVRLSARYGIIEKISDKYYSISKKGKHGIYSTVIDRIIVPVKYESVFLMCEGVWSAVNKGKVTYYNHKGKVVK